MLTKHSQRGQSIFETALFIPLFLLSLYGIFVVVTEGSMSERVQLGVRNGGTIFAPGNPYLSYSSYNLYSSLDGVDPADPNNNCNGALPDTTLLYASRPLFFKPAPSASAPVASCVYARGIAAINGSYYPLQSNFLKLSAQTGVSSYLVGKIIPTSTLNTYASQNFLRPGSIGQLMQSSSIGLAVKKSLEPQVDATTLVQTCTSPIVCPGFTAVKAPSDSVALPVIAVDHGDARAKTLRNSGDAVPGPPYSTPGF